MATLEVQDAREQRMRQQLLARMEAVSRKLDNILGNKEATPTVDAHRVFDERLGHLEANNSHMLRVTVSHVFYPVTEEVLHQVFDAFGAEKVYVHGRVAGVEALILFRSCRDAVRAREALHDRCIYDNCCWLDIQYEMSHPTIIIPVTPAKCSTPCPNHSAGMPTVASTSATVVSPPLDIPLVVEPVGVTPSVQVKVEQAVAGLDLQASVAAKDLHISSEPDPRVHPSSSTISHHLRVNHLNCHENKEGGMGTENYEFKTAVADGDIQSSIEVKGLEDITDTVSGRSVDAYKTEDHYCVPNVTKNDTPNTEEHSTCAVDLEASMPRSVQQKDEVFYSFFNGVSAGHERNGGSEESVFHGVRRILEGICLVIGEMPPWSRSAFSPGNSQIDGSLWVLLERPPWMCSGFSPGNEVTRTQIILQFASEYGSVPETVAYDIVLEVAMKAQHIQQRNLILQGSWKWLWTEFALYYGVLEAYTKLKYLFYIMDIATPTADWLNLVHELLLPVLMKSHSTATLSHQENRILGRVEEQIEQTLAMAFENYKSLDESLPTGLVASALEPAIKLYSIFHDVLSPEVQFRLCDYFQAAARKRSRRHMLEIDELVAGNSEGIRMDLVTFTTAYQKMESLCHNIRNEIFADIEIHNQHILPSLVDLPNLAASIYSVGLSNRLCAFLVPCPPTGFSPVEDLVIATAEFQKDPCSWNICPVKASVDAKELFQLYIVLWIEDKRRTLLENCRLHKVKWSGVRTQHMTTSSVDEMYDLLKNTLTAYEVIISRWPEYIIVLENAIADVEKAVIKSLEKQYVDVLGYTTVDPTTIKEQNVDDVPSEVANTDDKLTLIDIQLYVQWNFGIMRIQYQAMLLLGDKQILVGAVM